MVGERREMWKVHAEGKARVLAAWRASEKEPSSAPEPANNALPDLTPEPTKKKKSGKDVLGVTTKKVRPKFTENDLAKDNGLEWLPKHAPKRAKFQGRDITDARRLVDTYRAWAKQLFPSVPLDELLQRTDKFGHKMFVRGLVQTQVPRDAL